VRKIEKQMIAAILAKKDFKSGNTRVETHPRTDGALITSVYLFDNLIAQNGADGTWGFKLCGWDTTTTRSRINAVMRTVCPGNPGVHRVKKVLTLTQFDKSRTDINIVDWFWPEQSPK
jgi:hypothetical protein